jgi:hypothetical protein
MLFRTRVTEKQLEAVACLFTTTSGSEGANKVSDVLSRNIISMHKGDEDHDLRMKIIFRHGDGGANVFLLDDFGRASFSGLIIQYDLSTLQSIRSLAKSDLFIMQESQFDYCNRTW